MSKIRADNTTPEIIFRRALRAKGLRYRKNYSKLPGKPDVVFTKQKVAVFIDGEFWHGYNWEEKKGKIKNNSEYWISKIERNMERDKQNTKTLEMEGWKVLRFWTRQIKNCSDECIEMVIKLLNG